MNDQSAQEKRQLLARLLRERAVKASAAAPDAPRAAPLQRIPRTNAMELSTGQELMWAVEQLRPDSHNNILVRLELRGVLNREALRRSLDAVVARHEILRAIFPAVDGRPSVHIVPSLHVELPVVDLSVLGSQARAEEHDRLIRAAGHQQLDVSVGPLLRCQLLRFGPMEHDLLICLHHIVSDGWSVDLLHRDLARYYEGFATGKNAALPELTIQYVDFAHWQRRALSSAALAEQRHYWVKRLSGHLPEVALPFDRPTSTSRSFASVMRQFKLEPGLQSTIREFSRRQGVTVYTTLLTALNALLLRYSGLDDVVVGTFVAARTRVELEQVMGFFVNTLVLRTDYSGDLDVRAALLRTRDVVLEAQANADFPFDALVAELRPDRDASRSPLIDVVFNMQSYDLEPQIQAAGLSLRLLSTMEYFVVTDTLTLFGYDIQGRLELRLVYNPELFDAATIERFERHYINLLTALLADPARKLKAVSLLDLTEQRALLDLGCGPTTAFATSAGYAHYFRAQAAKTPHAVAASDAAESLTYAELNARSSAIAQLLLAEGVKPGEPVAMCSERGVTLLTWIVGALKAEAAYLPLDPRYPASRHALMLEQAQPRIVLAQQDVESAVFEGLHILRPGSAPTVVSGDPDAASHSGPSQLAYLIFTSGSTGVPKGAMVHQGAMLNHFRAKIKALALRSDDVVAQTAPIGFDISLWQWLAVLLAGGSVRVASEELTQDPARLFEMFQREGVTIAQVVPSVLRVFLDSYETAIRGPQSSGAEAGASATLDLPELRNLLLVGEALSPDLARRWLAHWPQIPLVNGYGPTECADEATRQVLAAAPEAGVVSIPIGRPIDNVQVHVLNRSAELLPMGVPGELYIGGAGVGLGYINDPERTSAAFVSARLGDGQQRLYRTGDRARMRPDGIVEFLGRLDFQVKIRGHRIELGEIESVIDTHPAVRQAVVHPWQSPTGQRLAAYVVAVDESVPLQLDELRAHLSRVLPSYMIPEDFLALSKLPLNANGKVDRRALPAPTTTAVREHVEPRTDIEMAIARVWGAVLVLDRIGIHDNFFDLGGHSLVAAQIAARLRTALQMEVSVRVLFEKQRLVDLANHLEAERARVSAAREEFVL